MKFLEYPDSIFYQTKNTKLLEWNKHFRLKARIPAVTAAGTIYIKKIYLKKPYYIKMGNLKPIEMYEFSFPEEKPKIYNTRFLLGLDFITKLKTTIEPSIDKKNIILTFEDLE